MRLTCKNRVSHSGYFSFHPLQDRHFMGNKVSGVKLVKKQ
jgi:hypothetical protein